MILSNLSIIFASSFMNLFPRTNPYRNSFAINSFPNELNDYLQKTAIPKLIINYILIELSTLVLGHLFFTIPVTCFS
ncbi:hypothetical protein DW888_18825 [Bacteroides nordii]|jgi:hypothetical protein|uniref:Uncharacterized protein n=2 Tax=Bacteroides nordii TaxID=291645 RepID=I8X3L3_9BACE|nr:hypothetical protein HMPREF1068_03994 [Bacteroides nordii CL02T12C05]RHB30409.1 hypothetical protein DW888_18825 [Bacteroides nordii]